MNESPETPSNEAVPGAPFDDAPLDDALPESAPSVDSVAEADQPPVAGEPLPDEVEAPPAPPVPDSGEAPAPEVSEEALSVDADQPNPDEPTYERDLQDEEPLPSAEEVALHVVLETTSPEADEAEDVVTVQAEAAEDLQAPATEEQVEEAEAEAEEVSATEEELPAIVDVTAEEEEAPLEPAAPDPFRGPGDWYVVHTYAGYENKVKTNLESRIHTMQMEDKIFDVHIPMEDVMEIKGGKKQVVQRKVFPGYLLVKMIYDNDSWYVVRNTPGVTGFVAAGTGSKPTPLSKREVDKILAVKKEEVKPTFRLGFEEEDVVRIISGPFADFTGTISEINVDQSKLKVLVNIFDRETPVELSFDQVAKV
jgi:transcriptional antiterminator NusG